MSGIRVSTVRSATVTQTDDLDASGIIKNIRTGGKVVRAQVEAIRKTFRSELAKHGDYKRAKEAIGPAKKQLPAVLWSGTFTKRANGKLVKHSGLLCADLDNLGSRLKDVREKLSHSPHVWAMFTSPSGDGLKVVFRVPADALKHPGSFRAAEQHVKELTGVEIDKACKDVARLCFLSYDPEVFHNPSAVEIEPLPEPEKPRSVKPALVDLSARQRIAGEILGSIDWQSETSGVITCPGKHLHTTGDGALDCKVDLDQVPTVHCFHDSCRGILDDVNHAIRSRIGKAEYGKTGKTAEEWPDPKPIQAPLYPVPAFDAKTLLPEALREFVADEAYRMPCPPDFVAATVIVALGSVVGARCAIKPKAHNDWLIISNLWGGLVGVPSKLKTPAMNAGIKPLDRLIAKAHEEYTAALCEFDAEKTVHAAQKDAIEYEMKNAAKAQLNPKKGSFGSNGSMSLEDLSEKFKAHQEAAPREPIRRRYKTNDVTVEKLGELLQQNERGLLVLRDELVGLLASWDREGREGERAFFLEAWNGNSSFDTDRISRGTILIPNLCVSIFGGIQPDKLTVYLEQAAHALANDGMLQRFQVLVYPDDEPWDYRDRIPNYKARSSVFEVFEKLSDFDPVSWGASPANDFVKFPYFRFGEEAQETFIEWSTELHKKIPTEDHPLIAQHLAKFDKLFPALALIFHLVNCASPREDVERPGGKITRDCALRAAAWCDYLEAHARRCYGLLVDDGLRAAQALVGKIKGGGLADGFTARDVRRNRWRYLATDEAVKSALDWLEDEGWIRAAETLTGGRPASRYSINPKLPRPAKEEAKNDEVA